MNRNDIERLLHCARHEAQGAGPNTLADVCEWALDRLDAAHRSETDAELRAEAAEAEAARWKAECERVMDSVQLIPDAEAAYTSGLIDRAEKAERERDEAAADYAQIRKLWNARVEEGAVFAKRVNMALNALGPSVPPCCDGCHSEWTEALRILKGERDE